MTWARCVCGCTRFELGFDAHIPLKSPARELPAGPSCLVCGECGNAYLVARDPGNFRPATGPNSNMIRLDSLGDTKLDPLLNQIERDLICQALEKTDGNRSQAAAVIGMSRSRFYRRMDALGIRDAG